jgi:hypothetical protein
VQQNQKQKRGAYRDFLGARAAKWHVIAQSSASAPIGKSTRRFANPKRRRRDVVFRVSCDAAINLCRFHFQSIVSALAQAKKDGIPSENIILECYARDRRLDDLDDVFSSEGADINARHFDDFIDYASRRISFWSSTTIDVHVVNIVLAVKDRQTRKQDGSVLLVFHCYGKGQLLASVVFKDPESSKLVFADEEIERHQKGMEEDGESYSNILKAIQLSMEPCATDGKFVFE